MTDFLKIAKSIAFHFAHICAYGVETVKECGCNGDHKIIQMIEPQVLLAIVGVYSILLTLCYRNGSTKT